MIERRMQEKYAKLLYWSVPVILFLAQVLFTFNSFHQIRFEELIESIQAPLWFNQRQVLAGTHTNVSWYAVLLLIYKLFGFSLATAKFFLLGVYLAFVVSLAALLRRLFAPLPAFVILTTAALSPTILFFNTQALHLGVGMQMVPVFILLLMLLDFKKKWISIFLTSLAFFLSMFVLLFYPPFMFYIPAIWLFWLRKIRLSHLSNLRYFSYLSVGLFAFLVPLILGFLYIENREILILDPDSGTGIFRGGGRIELSEAVFSQGLAGVFRDFFLHAGSYHFEVYKVDFSDLYPIITIITVIILITIIYKKEKKSRFLVNLILLTIGFNLLIVGITSDFGIPAMKRSTPILASIYFLWGLAWWWLEKRGVKIVREIWVIRVILGLLLVHHLIVYPVNLAHIPDPSPFRDQSFFSVKATPQQSLDFFLETLQKEDLNLDCRVFLTKLDGCQYDFIYSALRSACLWNKLNCHTIRTYDFDSGGSQQ